MRRCAFRMIAEHLHAKLEVPAGRMFRRQSHPAIGEPVDSRSERIVNSERHSAQRPNAGNRSLSRLDSEMHIRSPPGSASESEKVKVIVIVGKLNAQLVNVRIDVWVLQSFEAS